jgi:broad specificity phosphatase PhoE
MNLSFSEQSLDMKTGTFVLSILFAVSVAAAEPIVVVVRHAEKAANDPKDPDLSPTGQARAETLARMLKDAGVTAIFTSEFKRTQETAAPTSKSTGVVPTVVPGKDIESLVSKLHQLNGNALVVGHGDTIPNIIKALGADTQAQIPDNGYTELFIVALGAKPQLLRMHYP